MATKARTPAPIDYHDVMIALIKARAMASVLQQLGEASPVGNNLVHALEDGSHPADTREWLHAVVGEALRAALNDAEAAFRKSLTPKQAREHRRASVGVTGEGDA